MLTHGAFIIIKNAFIYNMYFHEELLTKDKKWHCGWPTIYKRECIKGDAFIIIEARHYYVLLKQMFKINKQSVEA